MGLDTFLKVMLRNWWLIVLAVLMTAGSTAFFVSSQPPIYRAVSTVELKPSPSLAEARYVISALEALDKRTTINTIARKATGSAMRTRVAQKLNIDPVAVDDAQIAASVMPETNLIQIRAQSTSPELAATLSNTIAQELLGEAFDKVLQMEVVDLATPPTAPIEPRPTRLISMGAIFGLILGIIFALLEHLIQTLQVPSGNAAPGFATALGGTDGQALQSSTSATSSLASKFRRRASTNK